MPLESDDALRSLLGASRVIAVLGIKTGAGDDAYRVPAYMQARGHRILPVNPRLERVLGEPCVPALVDLGETPDLINVFRAAAHVPGHVDEILALPQLPRGVWLQLGIRHDAAAARLEAAGISVVQDRCLMLEHGRLLHA
jgi:predicted CoA-binding protein